MSDGSDEAWEAESDDVGDNDSVPAVTPRRSKWQREPCDYAKEHSDNLLLRKSKGIHGFSQDTKGRRQEAKCCQKSMVCANNVCAKRRE